MQLSFPRMAVLLAAAAIFAAPPQTWAESAADVTRLPFGVAACAYPLPKERDPTAEDIAGCDAAIAAHEPYDHVLAELLIVRGAFHWNGSGDWDKATLDLVLSERYDDGAVPAAAYLRALTWLMMGQWERSVHEFTKLIGRNPNCGECYRHRAIAHLEQGRTADGLRDLLAARDLGVDGLDDGIAEAERAIAK